MTSAESVCATATCCASVSEYRPAIRSSFSGGDGKSMADIVAVAKFDSDEIAFFTKNYKAYVLDETDNSVKEVAASDL